MGGESQTYNCVYSLWQKSLENINVFLSNNKPCFFNNTVTISQIRAIYRYLKVITTFLAHIFSRIKVVFILGYSFDFNMLSHKTLTAITAMKIERHIKILCQK